jgi:hypothetical protein
MARSGLVVTGGATLCPMSRERDESLAPRGLPLAVDPCAKSASGAEPAFLNRPVDAPAYHGFQVLRDVEVEGSFSERSPILNLNRLTRGMRSSLLPTTVAPGWFGRFPTESASRRFSSRCGAMGCLGGFVFHPMSDRGNVKRNLEAILPRLKLKWEEWKAK